MALLPLTNLYSLTLDYCHGVTDDGIAKLAALPELESLSLTDCSLSDEGMPWSCACCVTCFTNGAHTLAAGMRHISQITGLKRLVVSCEGQEPWLSDEGLASIATLSSLGTLVLAGQELVSDAGAECIAAIKPLRCVYLKLVIDPGAAMGPADLCISIAARWMSRTRA